MRCRFCVSLRSAVFFGASINIVNWQRIYLHLCMPKYNAIYIKFELFYSQFLGAIHFFYFMMQMFLYFRYLRRPEQVMVMDIIFTYLLKIYSI